MLSNDWFIFAIVGIAISKVLSHSGQAFGLNSVFSEYSLIDSNLISCCLASVEYPNEFFK